MWQRKQTIYLILVIFMLTVLVWLPHLAMLHTAIAVMYPTSVGMPKYVFCLRIWDMNTSSNIFGFNSILFVLALIAAVIALVTIFLFNKRKLQMRMCRMGELSMLLWYVCMACVLYIGNDGWHVKYQFGCIFPLLAILFFHMAYKGVKHDDDLIRSADRIR